MEKAGENLVHGSLSFNDYIAVFPLPFQWTCIWIRFFSQYSGDIFGFVCCFGLPLPIQYAFHLLLVTVIPLLIQCPDLREGKGFIPVSIL